MLHHDHVRKQADLNATQKPRLPVYMPAIPPLRWINTVRLYVQTWRHRRWLRELLAYDDHMLADLGYTRDELRWAMALPPHINTAEALRDGGW